MILDYMQAWKISEKDFPADGTAAEKLVFCVNYAILAPSPYNNQPWYFKINDNRLQLCADRRHGLAVIDPDDREMTLCCAARLFGADLGQTARFNVCCGIDCAHTRIVHLQQIGAAHPPRPHAEIVEELVVQGFGRPRHQNFGLLGIGLALFDFQFVLRRFSILVEWTQKRRMLSILVE